jgi:hypothetical protein
MVDFALLVDDNLKAMPPEIFRTGLMNMRLKD